MGELQKWLNDGFTSAKSARIPFQTEWYNNLTYLDGNQWDVATKGTPGNGNIPTFRTQKSPYYRKQRTINRLRSFHRTEQSQFLQSIPTVTVVPGTAEGSDVRAAFAAEQAWNSVSEAQHLRRAVTVALWWMGSTGLGIVKTQWTKNGKDYASGENGCIEFGSVNPFHLYFPDMRVDDIEEQPWVTQAIVKPLEWAKKRYGEKIANLKASTVSAGSIVEEAYLKPGAGAGTPDSVVIYETWVKPGTTDLLPDGGVVTAVDDIIVNLIEKYPYDHGMYPYTIFSNIPTPVFYPKSSLVDLIPLQREYNDYRTDLAEAARRSGRPMLLAPKGSIDPKKVTNEPGQVVTYTPGGPPPQWMPMPTLPEYITTMPDRVLQDFEDVGGQHDVSKGQAPPGVQAGTALSYLGEKDTGIRLAQYQSIEDGYERIASQTLQLFVQYVDVPRKIKTIGMDMIYDVQVLSGADIKNGTDVRVEKGSAQGESKAASDAKVMDMWSLGIIVDPNKILELLEVGQSGRSLDLFNVADRKASRENQLMRSLTPADIEESENAFAQMVLESIQQGQIDPMGVDDPQAAIPGQSPAPGEMNPSPVSGPPTIPPPPPVVAVADFDEHEVHIANHNRYRMGQEYEMLAPEIKAQFEKHVKAHEQALMQKQMMSFLNMIPSDGSDGEQDDQNMDVPTGVPAEGGAMMADNGQVPDPSAGGGETNG